MESHAEFLRLVALDEELAAALRRDYREAPLPEQDRAMLDFAVRLTREPWKMSPDDLGHLRRVGFDGMVSCQVLFMAEKKTTSRLLSIRKRCKKCFVLKRAGTLS